MQAEDLIERRERSEFILSDLFLLGDFFDDGFDGGSCEGADVFVGGCGWGKG
jgi:hypothetical protein